VLGVREEEERERLAIELEVDEREELETGEEGELIIRLLIIVSVSNVLSSSSILFLSGEGGTGVVVDGEVGV